MRTWLIPVACFVLGAPHSLAFTRINLSESVEVLTAQPSARNVRITVDVNGVPAPGAVISVYAGNERFLFRVSANSSGTALLRRLSPGSYHVAAAGEGDLRSDIVLMVSKKTGESSSVFQMDLLHKSAPPPHDEYSLMTANLQVTEQVPDFKGQVVDPLGAVIPGALIEIHADGAKDGKRTVQIKTADDGSFQEHLADGTYRALVMFPGFKTNFLVFQISRSATDKNLRVPLQIGGCS
jgi:carboxypeptidase family protein